MTGVPPGGRSWITELAELTLVITEFKDTLQDSTINRYFRDAGEISKLVKTITNLPVFKEGKKLLGDLSNAMSKAERVQVQALATNKNLISTISNDQIRASFQLGVAIAKLSEDVLTLREAGVMNLNSSTMKLAARMRATGQDTQSLIKFLKSNTSVMMLNQKEAQNLAADLAKFSGIYSARQDDVLNLATSLSKSFEIQSQLGGGGGNLESAFAAFGATLGNRVDPLIQQVAGIFGKGDLGQLIQLGIADLQQGIMAETDPARQAEMIKQLVLTASRSIEQRTAGLGTSVADRQIYKQLIQSMGGENILAFKQLAKALEDQKSADSPLFSLENSITTLKSIFDIAVAPLTMFGGALLAFINLPVVNQIVKLAAYFYGIVTTFALAATTFKVASIIFSRSILVGATKLLIASFKFLLASLPFQALVAPLLAIAAIAGAAYGIWSMMSSDIKDINRKTPDTRTVNAGLTGQIFSQLVNIVTSTGSNAIQRENLATQKELVRLIKQQTDRTDPNNAPATKPITRRI